MTERERGGGVLACMCECPYMCAYADPCLCVQILRYLTKSVVKILPQPAHKVACFFFMEINPLNPYASSILLPVCHLLLLWHRKQKSTDSLSQSLCQFADTCIQNKKNNAEKHTFLCGHFENINNSDSHIDLQCFCCLFIVILTLEFPGFLTLTVCLQHRK